MPTIPQDPLLVPVLTDDDEPTKEIIMAEPTANQGLAAELIGQSMAGLAGIANVAQANFVTINKALDYAFMEERNMVSLPEALGAREVGSKSVPAGPTATG